MGNFTPKPAIQQIKKKLVSKTENSSNVINCKDEVPTIKNKYKKLKIRERAPNCVQKNIR
jgi:hypothetical protein